MKQKLTLLFSFLVIVTCAFAQMSDSKYASAVKGNVFAVEFNTLDIKTPETFKNSSTPRTFSGIQDMDYGLSFLYFKEMINSKRPGGRCNDPVTWLPGHVGHVVIQTRLRYVLGSEGYIRGFGFCTLTSLLIFLYPSY